MRRILFVNHTLDFKAGGAEQVLFDLLQGIDRAQFDVALAVPQEAVAGAQHFRDLRLSCIALPRLPLPKQRTRAELCITGWHLAKLNFALFWVLLRLRPQVVYVNSIVSLHFAFLPAWLLRKRIVYHEHGLASARVHSVWHRLLPFFAKRVDRIIAITESVRGEVLQLGIPAERVVTIHNGISPRSETPRPPVLDPHFEKFAEGSLVCGQIANLHDWKGHETVLRAMPMVLQAESTARYVAFGQVVKPAHYAALEQLRKDLQIEAVTWFAGFREEVEVFLPKLQCLIIASTAEPFGLVALQAMRAGVPVVATARGGIPEIIEHEVNGLLVEPNDPDAMASAILRILRDAELRKKIIANGYKTVQEKFSIAAQVRSVESILASVAS